MGNTIDINGKRFGKLTVIERSHNDKYGSAMWKCTCDCGNTSIVKGGQLRSGRTKTCGCLKDELFVKRNTKHGLCHRGGRTTEYHSWQAMKMRCLNRNYKQYKDYGGRGIKVCDRWLNSFTNFLKDMGKKPDKLHTIDRIDNDGNYTPENCQWADWETQSSNKRPTKTITVNGVTMQRTDAFNKYGIQSGTFYRRKALGWSDEEALTKPVGDYQKQTREKNNSIIINGVTKTKSQWIKHFGTTRSTVNSRLRRGMAIEDALATPIDNRFSHS